ncbi:plexin-A2-like [Glandiceps talaboti]
METYKISLFLVLMFVTVCQCQNFPKFVETNEITNNAVSLQRMTLDGESDSLLVGSVNRIYRLSSALQKLAEGETGPKNDNTELGCLPPDFDGCIEDRVPTDNVNKLLVLDTATDWIIACGNVHKGICQTRNKDTLEVVKNYYRQVTSAGSSLSAVGFIGPGPSGNVLYVGRSYMLNTDPQWDALTSRILPSTTNDNDAFTVVSTEFTTNSASIRGRDDFLAQNPTFNIDYVYGFTSNDFTYYVAIQPKTDTVSNGPFVTKIIQICQSCAKYRETYIDLPLVCKGNDGSEYGLAQSAYVVNAGTNLADNLGLNSGDNKAVLMVAFAKAEGTSKTPTQDSAVCVYSIKSIREKYLEWVDDCSGDGSLSEGCEWAIEYNPDSCGSGTLKNVVDTHMCYCEFDYGAITCGSLEIINTAAYTSSGSKLTAISAATHLDHTIVFMGNEDGKLKKLKVVSSTSALEYEDIAVVSNNPEIVQNGLMFDKEENYIYVMSKRQITKVPVENCEQYTDCEDCTSVNGVGDPYCGWCSLENKCTRKVDCTGSSNDNDKRWIGSDRQCPSIDVNPASVERGDLLTLTLTVTSLPETSAGFSCVFANLGDTAADREDPNSNQLKCLTPSPSNVPSPGDRGYVRVKLSLFAEETGQNFVDTDFDFYECESFKTCMACTNNDYGCDWCIFQNKCSKDTSKCNNGVVQGNANQAGGSDSCPRIEGGQEILIPVDLSKDYEVTGQNFPVLSPEHSGYQCVLDIEGEVVVVDGQMLDPGKIKCQSSKYMYAADVSSKLVPLQLRWNNDFYVDNPDDVKVTLYKCDVSRPNCGVCHQVDIKYQCGWCEIPSDNQKCTVINKCNPVNNWLTRDNLCPNPTITQIQPMAGPVEGGTTLTIRGYNLGKNSSDVKGIKVAGLTCVVQGNGYKISEQVQCITSASGSVKSGKVGITIGDADSQASYSGSSSEEFSYVNSRIDSISPKIGPRSGGTKVTITGQHLNAGSDITVMVAGSPCDSVKTSADYAECITTAANNNDQSGGVTMSFDGVVKSNTAPQATYMYKQDPEIKELSRYAAFISGGITIQVTGTNLDIVHTRQMRVYIKDNQYTAPCILKSPTQLVCEAPDVSESNIKPTAKEPFSCDYGFILDSVQNTTHLKDTSLGPFLYYPNPYYTNFEDGSKVYSGVGKEPLVILGENLTLASDEHDVIVKIGDDDCEVTSLAWNQLTCNPPETPPKGSSAEKGLQVTIYHGNLNVSVGFLKYASDGPALSTGAIAGIAAGGAVAIIIIVFILIIYKRKSSEKNRAVKMLQIKLDSLESDVVKVCKEAFAELQTEVTEMTTDIEGAGIPFLDYRSYTMRVLFPGQEDHPVLRELEVKGAKRADVEKGLREFGKLVTNKTFLLNFIRTLEGQKSFSMRDRVNVASLIMVSLQSRMEYATEILKALLSELIDKTLEGKNHPKLLLRRTESIAEKMLTNWLTFLLYSFLKEAAGEPLFMCYRALRQQIEKGPVDSITHEARYSLSEEKLIRQEIEYKTYCINVVNPDTLFDKEEQYIQVKVLDCDSIGQVKEKFLDAIYKNAPFSSRPRVDQVDLEWRQGYSGRLSLADDDITAKVEGEWKRINTLEHYKVLDGAVMALVPKQGYNMSPGVSSLKTGNPHFNMSLTSSPGHRSTSSMLINAEADSGHRAWHLIKQHDNDGAQKEGARNIKMVSEIYLTRLLTTKGTLQKFVDDLFETIFSTTHRGSALPLAIKYLFDFLDDQAIEHGISDPDVVHTWKSNSLPLRFWVNLIKNPDFVFDVYKSQTVDACLSVVAQTFMDSCSTSVHKLGKDSPSSKLLYAKDIPKYREWVYSFYQDIKRMPVISDQDMNSALAEESRLHQHDFNQMAALNELYFYYSQKYNDELIESLECDELASRSRLAYKWEQISAIMAGQQ